MLTNRMVAPARRFREGPESARAVRSSLPRHPHDERGAAIEPPRLLAGVVVLRPLLAVADGLEPVGRNPAAGEVLAHGSRPALAEREVVLRRADVAGVAFDLDPQIGVRLE